MVQINFAQKSVTVKIVYYGPGMSGKTTNLEIVHQRAPDGSRGDLTSISTDGDRTLFFDFMPLDLGTVAGMRTQFQIYTVPGQVYYNSTRKLVLQGVDGVIFIADSGASMMDENLESLANLEENLAEYGKDIAEMPLIIQYNKRDLPDALPVAELEARLNPWGKPSFEAIASSGQGVFPTLKALAAKVLESIHDRTGSGGGGGAPAPQAPPMPPQAAAPAPQVPQQPIEQQGMPQAAAPASPFPQPSPLSSVPAPLPNQAPVQPPVAPPMAPAPMGGVPAGHQVAQNQPGMNPNPGAPGGMGVPQPGQPQLGTGAFPTPQAPAQPQGGLSIGAPLNSQPNQPNQAPQTAFAAPNAGGMPHPAPGLGQTGMQPGYQPGPAPMSPQLGQTGIHPSLSQTGIHPGLQQPQPQPGMPNPMGTQPMPGYGGAPAPFPATGMPPAGQPAQQNQVPARPQPQSTRLKPRSQTVTITPTQGSSGKGKWVFMVLLVLAAGGAAAAYFMELI